MIIVNKHSRLFMRVTQAIARGSKSLRLRLFDEDAVCLPSEMTIRCTTPARCKHVAQQKFRGTLACRTSFQALVAVSYPRVGVLHGMAWNDMARHAARTTQKES